MSFLADENRHLSVEIESIILFIAGFSPRSIHRISNLFYEDLNKIALIIITFYFILI